MKFNQSQFAFACVRILAAGLLFWASAKHPIGYYTFLEFIVCATAAYGAYNFGQFKQAVWVWIMVTVVILFNPLLPVHLKRHDWAYVDPSVAILFLVSIPALYQARTKQKDTAI